MFSRSVVSLETDTHLPSFLWLPLTEEERGRHPSTSQQGPEFGR